MRVCRQVRLPDPGEQVDESRVARGVGPQHQGVDEEPDQLVQFRLAATGDRGADRNVLPRPEFGQQRRQRGMQDHERRGVVRRREPGQRGMCPGVNGEFQGVAAIRRDGGPGTVGGQLDPLRRSGQGLAPERQLPRSAGGGVVLVSEDFSLPQGEVRVLHG